MNRLNRAAPLAALLLATVAAVAHAQAPAQPNAVFAATTLNLSAYGEARIEPDMATITLGVESAAPTAARAMADNAARMTQLAAAIRRAGVAPRNVQTTSLNLGPQYVYAQDQPPKLTGYKASSQLIVTVTDLARLGEIADAAVAAGATDVGQISLGLANPLSAENTARVAAVKALEDKASLYANAVGYRIVRLVNLSEGGGYSLSPPRPIAMMALRAPAAPTPIEEGELKVRIDVTGVFELAH
ncbi:MAG TPA: SIMPL domain-containing protein [Caulobacteraceae bacterium]